MNKTKIEWCDMTWNPVTGCYHNCPYCYAAKIVKRFGKCIKPIGDIVDLYNPPSRNGTFRLNPYPFGFYPTFKRYLLNEPQHYRKPQNIFVCSMADLFGNWVPDEWIQEVFKACGAAPQHRYLFLTKSPSRYIKISNMLPQGNNFWYGTTITNQETPHFWSIKHNTFISIEPLLEPFGKSTSEIKTGWVIIGAETGNRIGKVIPKREWIENIVEKCREQNVRIFMKDSLAEIWGQPLIQEYPW